MSLLNFFKPVNGKGEKRKADDAAPPCAETAEKLAAAAASPKKIKVSKEPSEKAVSPPPSNENEQFARIAENQKKSQLQANKQAVHTTATSQEKQKTCDRTTANDNLVAYSNVEELIHDEGWKKALALEFEKPYFKQLKKFLQEEEDAGKIVYPPKHQIFRAFNVTTFDQVRIVIIGQDPYHGPAQAEGLCFSVSHGEKIPSSLQNIYKEIGNEIPEFKKPSHGSLLRWAEQGVLLLNTGLTVRKAEANSHNGKGWQKFTDEVIKILSTNKQGLVFLLWGKNAQVKKKMISAKHKVLESVHPSGLSAHRGFFGNGHFAKANEYLIEKGLQPVNWQP